MQTSKSNTDFLAEGFAKCKEITRKYGTSYFFATQFFPKEIRSAIYAIYAFARIPDEIVDNPELKDNAAAIAELEKWREKWLTAMREKHSDDAVMAAVVETFYRFKIPVSDGEAFLKSMFADKRKFRYQTYSELEEYMYGSAGVIGLMVTRIVGYSDEKAFNYALKLGYAFQITNFLRDIRQDCKELGRIYMPEDELKQFGLTHEDIVLQTYDERFIEFMKFQIKRNREIYRESLPGIPMLAWRGRLAVKISYVLYRAILDEIEKANYDIWSGRARTNFKRKLILTGKAVAGKYE